MTTTAIHIALDALYADPHISEAATLEPIDGPPYPVKVVVERSEQAFDITGLPVRTKVRILNVRRKDAQVLHKGDQFHFQGGWKIAGGSTLEVIEDPPIDHVSEEWTAQVVEHVIPA